ncbi:MAG: 5'/3'-nucleotidase SurE [Rhizobiales bacterium 17-65-6]|nr:MAG: 5'/3'-nucleotidase SurE [Rhizobiales bacterium 12-68-15]OYX88480.1 MAG: 5'/3'-nucleotidase SurE [Azorhizobium sp. 32-67-21]OYZ90575.1 MAG: 5'/3'-nucleotidase SurE [Rhizobiales bacterium 17-65-6]
MRILVTNDDGIHAPGLDSCVRIAQALSDDVWVVAPEFDQSGVAHSLSLSDPLRLREVAPKRFALKGTPTDCVIMAVRHILDAPPDLILSGVNRGQNIAEDVSYSGTVAGAIEGTILGIPSVALSQAFGPATRDNPSYETAEAYGPGVVRTVLKEGIPAGIVINVNFPDRLPAEVEGIAVAAQGKRDQKLMRIEARRDGRNNPYFWIAFERRVHSTSPGTDLRALDEGRISVTPLRVDQTDEPFMTRLAQVFDAAPLEKAG